MDWVNPSRQKYSKIVSEDKTSAIGLCKSFWTLNILKYFLRSKQAWTDWANHSRKKCSKMVSEAKQKWTDWVTYSGQN